MKTSGSSLVTNGKIRTGASSKEYRDNYDKIFKKKKDTKEVKVTKDSKNEY